MEKKKLVVKVVLSVALILAAMVYIYYTEKRLADIQNKLVAGLNSVTYINAGIQTGIFPTIAQLNERLQQASSTK